MKFRQSGGNRVEIVLTPKEVSALRLSPDGMDCENPYVRRVLSELVRRAARELGFSLEVGFSGQSGLLQGREEFLLEISDEQENTVLTVSPVCFEKQPGQSAADSPKNSVQLYRFAGSEEMICACLALSETLKEKIGKSSLYRLSDGRFCLMLVLEQAQEEKVKRILLEYGEKARRDSLAAAVLAEHMPCFLPDTAIQTIQNFFSR